MEEECYGFWGECSCSSCQEEVQFQQEEEYWNSFEFEDFNGE